MKYDGFQRVAQRFEVLWPESIRYATSALQERLSTSCFYSNNHPYCTLRWSSVFGLTVELKEDHHNNKNDRKCTVVKCVYTAPAPGSVFFFFFFFLFFFLMIWDELALAEFITFTVVFLLDLVNCVNNSGLPCMRVIFAATKQFPHFLFSVKTNYQNFIIFMVLRSEKLKEKFTATVFTQRIFSSLQYPRVWLGWI